MKTPEAYPKTFKQVQNKVSMSREIKRMGMMPERIIQGSVLIGIQLLIVPEERGREEPTGMENRNMDEKPMITEEF